MTSCGLIRDGLFTNWKFGFDSDPRLLDLKLLALELFHFFLRSRYENATPNLCWVCCALLGLLCN